MERSKNSPDERHIWTALKAHSPPPILGGLTKSKLSGPELFQLKNRSLPAQLLGSPDPSFLITPRSSHCHVAAQTLSPRPVSIGSLMEGVSLSSGTWLRILDLPHAAGIWEFRGLPALYFSAYDFPPINSILFLPLVVLQVCDYAPFTWYFPGFQD